MKIRPISFTGMMYVEGDTEQHRKVQQEITKYVSGLDAKDSFEHEYMSFGEYGENGRGVLYTTQEEAKTMNAYEKFLTKRLLDSNLYKNGLPNEPWLDTEAARAKVKIMKFDSFFKEKPNLFYSTEEVLLAIKNGLFDFANHVIKQVK